MKWFDNWFANKCRKVLGIEHDHQEEDNWSEPQPHVRSKRATLTRSTATRNVIRGLDVDSIDLPEGGLNIQVKSAIGGKIVIFRTYDERNDRNCYSTYLIPDSEIFQESLGKIITLESLKL